MVVGVWEHIQAVWALAIDDPLFTIDDVLRDGRIDVRALERFANSQFVADWRRNVGEMICLGLALAVLSLMGDWAIVLTVYGTSLYTFGQAHSFWRESNYN